MYSLYIRISMNPIDWFDSPLGADAEQKKMACGKIQTRLTVCWTLLAVAMASRRDAFKDSIMIDDLLPVRDFLGSPRSFHFSVQILLRFADFSREEFALF